MHTPTIKRTAEAFYEMATFHAALGILLCIILPPSLLPTPILLAALAAWLTAYYYEGKIPNRDRDRNRLR